MNISPWARVLNIAIGSDPNGPSESASRSASTSSSSSISPSPSASASSSVSAAISKTPSNSRTPSVTRSQTPTSSKSAVESSSPTSTVSPSISESPSRSPSPSASATRSSSISESITPSRTNSGPASKSSSRSESASISFSISVSKTSSLSGSSTRSLTGTNTVTISVSPKPSLRIVEPSNAASSSSSSSGTKTRSVIPIIANSVQPVLASVTPNIIPTSAGDTGGCINCQFGEVQTVLQPADQTNTDTQPEREVSLVSNVGAPVGTLLFSNNEGNTNSLLLDVAFVTNIPINLGGNDQLGRTIIDISIQDSYGNEITELAEPLTICLTEDKTDDDVCLSFFNVNSGEWECEDKCLTRELGQYCGSTDHLTSFALLLSGGGGGSGDPCDSNSDDYLYAWLSLGFVAGAICCMCFAILLIEFKYRREAHLREIEFKRLSSAVNSNM